MYLLQQPEKTEILCQSVVRVAEKNGGHLVESATEVADLFKTSLGLFSLCHNTYNATQLKIGCRNNTICCINIRSFQQYFIKMKFDVILIGLNSQL